MVNKKYTVTDKNGGCIPTMKDERVAWVEVPCGQCEECREVKAREWRVRLTEEIKNYEYNYFVTLTFSPEGLKEIMKRGEIGECNAAAAYAVRHMLEYYRKDHKKSLRHWLITEMGHQSTERIHMHGIFCSHDPIEWKILKQDQNGYKVEWKYWRYGLIFIGNYCTVQTINYIVKYITKIDTDHKGFIGTILASPGIGKGFLSKIYTNMYKYKPGKTIDYYREENGARIKLPRYYKNKLYNEEERELIWRDYMDKEQTTMAGNVYQKDVENGIIGNIQRKAQEQNKFHGFGDDSKEWRKKPYNITRRMLRRQYLDEIKQKNIRKCENKQELQKIVKNYNKYLDI